MKKHTGKGFLVIAQNSQYGDYIRQAYALALSLRNTQNEIDKLSICVTKKSDVPEKYIPYFDNIIEIPFGDHASDSNWKVDNKWKYYYMTPYYETIVLDSDMLFTNDVKHWWDFLSNKELWFTSSVNTFRGEKVTSDFYRKVFTNNQLPNLYTAFFYFKQCDLAAELFEMTSIIFHNWEKFYWEFLDDSKPKHLSGDVCFALAAKILGIEHLCHDINMNYPSFTHMKSFVQNVPETHVTKDWTKHFPCYVNSQGKISVCNYDQSYIFHYHINEWLTDDTVRKLENAIQK